MDQIGFNLEINRLKQLRDSLIRETSELTKERDKIRNEIKDQREGKSTVYHEMLVAESQKVATESVLNETKKALEQSHDSFVAISDKEREILSQIRSQIQTESEKLEQLKKYTANSAKMEEMLIIQRKELREKSRELAEIERKFQSMQAEADSIKKELDWKLAEIANNTMEMEEKARAILSGIEKREKDVSILEKRYNLTKK